MRIEVHVISNIAKRLRRFKKNGIRSWSHYATIIGTDKIVVEERIVFKCRFGCVNYGKTLSWPPHTPTAEEFRKIVSECSYALFMKFWLKAQADPE